jgi:mRNA interferase HigB
MSRLARWRYSRLENTALTWFSDLEYHREVARSDAARFRGPGVHVISRKRLREFWDAHPDAETPLAAWYRIARGSDWTCFADIRQFAAGSADAVGRCVVFNIGGNKYRLVVRVHYASHKVYVVGTYTHREYDEDRWKCEC